MSYLIFTNHALDRLAERRMSRDMVITTFSKPDETKRGKKDGTTEFIKHFDKSLVTLIATQNEHKEWIALSCWIDPPHPGTKDYQERERHRAYHKAGFWGKVWLIIRSQLGL